MQIGLMVDDLPVSSAKSIKNILHVEFVYETAELVSQS